MEVTKAQILRRLPEFQGILDVSVIDQDTPDIIAAILESHREDRAAYDRICDLFDGASGEEVGQKLFHFLKTQTRYVAEDEELQTVRSPAAIIQTGSIDCKNYALFTGGNIDALNRTAGAGIKWCYRFAAYSKGGVENRYLRHVFVVLYPGDPRGEIWVDPVLSSFNSREKTPCYYKDATPMLGRLSGIQPGARRTMGQDTGSDSTDYTNYDTYDSYDSGSGYDSGSSASPQTSTDTSGSDVQPFVFSSTALAAATAPNPTVTPTDPTASFDPATATDEIAAYDPAQAVQDTLNANWLDSFMKSVLGSATPSGGGGSGGGGSAGGGAQQKPQTQQALASTAPATTTGKNNTIIIVAVLAAVGLGIYFINKK